MTRVYPETDASTLDQKDSNELLAEARAAETQAHVQSDSPSVVTSMFVEEQLAKNLELPPVRRDKDYNGAKCCENRRQKGARPRYCSGEFLKCSCQEWKLWLHMFSVSMRR